MMKTESRTHVAATHLEANLCDGTGLLAIALTPGEFWGSHRYDPCPGCVGCDYDTVSARAASVPPGVAFSRFPCDDDEGF